MTRIKSEQQALRFWGRLEDSVALLERDGDMAAFHARQRVIWDAIESTGAPTKDRVLGLIRAGIDQRRTVTV